MKNLIVLLVFPFISVCGQSKCYLEYHMNNAIAVKDYCYGSDTSRFMKVLSPQAHQYVDSVFKRLNLNIGNVRCKKLTLKEGWKEVANENVKSMKYFYTAFERTFDCFDKYYTKNYRGRVRTDEDTKIFLEYMLGVSGNFEMLRIYVLNNR